MDIVSDSIIEELALSPSERSIITVVGVGGAGGNAVNYMWNMGIQNVGFIVCNTDQQALNSSPVNNKVRLGEDGLGAGNDPERGRDAALHSLDKIRDQIVAMDTQMLFIAAGMGGGTGTGAGPIIAKLAHELKILTIAIVTTPLIAEGQLRYDQAMKGIEELRENVDSLLVINNENIGKIYGNDLSAKAAFGKANEILSCAAKGIAEIITINTSFINVDFADVARVMRDSGRAHMSVESARGENRAEEVAKKLLTSPLLDKSQITGAKNILLNMAVSDLDDLKWPEITKILDYIQNNASVMAPNGDIRTANIIWGMSEKAELGDALEMVMVATGFQSEIDEIDEYSQAKRLLSNAPASPFERMNEEQRSRINTINGIAPTPPASPVRSCIVSDGKIMLPEREVRYPNIEALLKIPAYMAHNAKMITEDHKRSEAHKGASDDSTTSLFG